MTTPEPDPARRARDEFADTGVFQSTSPTAPGEHAGDLIDRYKLLQTIGEGGMGTVWMAEQKEPVRRQVALKIIKLGMDTREVVVRFEAERQALALMDHPNIAKVLDGGATAQGRPFFVMELVRGVPITQYCDEQKLGIRARLELFTKVCEAIQHAHLKGVIHRDIKPSNVMVTLHDGTPVPKVIDFGIAKATSVELTQKTLFTQYGNIIGTPEYMAPEQAAMSGLDIDTRADVYSLGVLLYELLTGSKPFDITKVLEKGYQELLRTIREEEPAKPSTRVSTMGEKTPLALRHANVGKLSSRLRGDLDWIVMRALEKDRARRYETASGFAADVARYLHGEPVHAAPPSSLYKLRKFVRRNRARVTAAAIVLVTLVAGLIGTGSGLYWALDEKDKADRAAHAESLARQEAQAQSVRALEQAEAAEAARARAEEVAAFVGDILSGAGPSIARGRDATVLREMMDRAVAMLEDADATIPAEAQIVLRHLIGGVYVELAAFDAAERVLRQGLELLRQGSPGENEHLARTLLHLAKVHAGRSEFEAADARAQEALEVFRRLPGDHTAGCVECLDTISGVARVRGDQDRALAKIREALAANRRQHPGDHPGTAAFATSLGGMLLEQNDFAGAEAALREGVGMYERLFAGEDHPHVAGAIGQLALLLHGQGKTAAALPLAEQSLAMSERVLGPDHPHVATALANVAVMLLATGSRSRADELSRRALEIHRHSFPGDHHGTSVCLNNLGLIRKELGDLEGAERLFREALAIARRLYSTDNPWLATCLGNLGDALRARGEFEEALALIRESAVMFERIYPGDHALVAEILAIRGEAEAAAGELDAAETSHDASLAMRRRLFPDGHPDVAASLQRITNLHLRRGDLQAAERVCREWLEVARRVHAGDHLDVAVSLGQLGAILRGRGEGATAGTTIDESLAMFARLALGDHEMHAELLATRGLEKLSAGDLDAAEEPLQQGLEMARRLYPDGNPNLVVAQRFVATLRDRQGDHEAALALWSECLEMQQRLAPLDQTGMLAIVFGLAGCYQHLGRRDDAHPHLERALQLAESAFGKKHPETTSVRNALGVNHLDAGRVAEALPILERARRDGRRHPQRLDIDDNLLTAYEQAADADIPFDREVALTLARESVARARTELAAGSVELASALARRGRIFLLCGRPAEAEPLLRECVEVRAARMADHWLRFNAMSLLGDALLQLGRHADAEPVLLEGFLGMKQRVATIPPAGTVRLAQAIERLVKLYEAKADEGEAAAWRSQLEAARSGK